MSLIEFSNIYILLLSKSIPRSSNGFIYGFRTKQLLHTSNQQMEKMTAVAQHQIATKVEARTHADASPPIQPQRCFGSSSPLNSLRKTSHL